MSATLEPIPFKVVPGWQADDHSAALAAFVRTARRHVERPFPARRFGGDDRRFMHAATTALTVAPVDACSFFESCFTAVRIRPAGSGPGPAGGFVTGFYEPVVEARLVRDDLFRFPVHAPPPDLVEVPEGAMVDGLPAGTRFARKTSAGFEAHHDRAAVTGGALDGQGLEIAWVRDAVDLFFAHVQGAARLDLGGGRMARITYAAKSGHPFTGIGRLLVERGEIAPEAVSMQAIRAWLAAHPGEADAVMAANRSYIYFRFSDAADHAGLGDDAGPVAAAKVPLTSMRSVAVDRQLHRFGMPFFVSVPGLHDDRGQLWRRLMIAQDTGTAITGPARLDLFTGSGKQAGERAGVIRHAADIILLVPR